MKHDKEARRKSDEKRKRKKYDNDYDGDEAFRGKVRKKPSHRLKLDPRFDDSEWHDNRY